MLSPGPRDPESWPVPEARPVPKFTEDALALGQAVSVLGKTLVDGLRGYAAQNNIKLDGLPEDPQADIPPEQIMTVLRSARAVFFPLLAPAAAD